ncbi:MAG: hypothetical protein V4456_11680 [Bacteroidota bacterium]
MKYLKIDDNKCFFLRKEADETSNWIAIDLITKEDLFQLLNKAITEDFYLDEFIEDKISNKAHQIIYKNLCDKFSELILNKNRFKDESENLYKVALEKYKVE